MRIYEINTPIFLREVGERLGRAVTLAEVPDSEWDIVARPGIDTVWFMGIWERSRVAKEMAAGEPWLRKALPDMQPGDLLGSAYSIQRYAVAEAFGGNEALAAARKKLQKRGIKIILDYVPNHVGIDHHWVAEHPDYFLRGTEQELRADPQSFVQTPSGIFAKGKDPNFEPWSDVLQLNAFSKGLREETVRTLRFIGSISDGVRCDMAMLMMNTIFKKTWGDRAGTVPTNEYWPTIIEAVRAVHPNFTMLAEVYWGKERDLLKQGFDFCYDKELYDLLLSTSTQDIQRYVQKPVAYQNHLLRFIENHDEERAAATLAPRKHKAAAVILATLPGAQLYHDGQREGRKVRVPVHFGRRVDEDVDNDLAAFYDKLFSFIDTAGLPERNWRPLAIKAGLLKHQSEQVLAWEWVSEDSRLVVMVNYSPRIARVKLPFAPKLVQKVMNIEHQEGDIAEHINSSNIKLTPWQHVIFEMHN